MASYTGRKDDYLNRLRRIEGQVRGLQKMVEQDKYCIDVLTQVAAATKALQAFSLQLLEEHLATCVVHAARAGDGEAEEKVREAADAIARLVGPDGSAKNASTNEGTPAVTTTTYTVKGLTCGHCVSSVSSEIGALAGVTGVDVDLASGAVTVTSERPLDPVTVRAAVDEAGYELVT